MNESQTTVPTKTKKQLRIEAAEKLQLDYIEEEGSDDIVNDLKCRAHTSQVLEALGFANGLSYLADAVDKRVACGLAPLPVIELAFAGTLVRRIEESKDEIVEVTLQNAEDARKAKLKREQQGPGADRRNGPVRT